LSVGHVGSTLDFRAVVTKKQRRKQLAQASAHRQATKRAQREHRRKLLQLAATLLVLVVALAGLAFWIATHGSDSSPDNGSAGTRIGDYHVSGAVLSPTASAEVDR
jgi:ferric-dicitrate binding protein FerR (iron transport regulator)